MNIGNIDMDKDTVFLFLKNLQLKNSLGIGTPENLMRLSFFFFSCRIRHDTLVAFPVGGGCVWR